jgi:quercetin dioxygenase-like cupin family protein
MIYSQSLGHVELYEEVLDSVPPIRLLSNYVPIGPVSAPTVTVVYMVMPDRESGVAEHRDSEDEVILILKGEITVTVGDEQEHFRSGDLVLVPANTLHTLRNAGSAEARAIGFFPGRDVVTVFTEPLRPTGGRRLAGD